MKEYEMALIKEKGDVINKALKLVNKLAENQMVDSDGFDDDLDLTEVKKLIIQARTLKHNELFEDLIK